MLSDVVKKAQKITSCIDSYDKAILSVAKTINLIEIQKNKKSGGTPLLEKRLEKQLSLLLEKDIKVKNSIKSLAKSIQKNKPLKDKVSSLMESPPDFAGLDSRVDEVMKSGEIGKDDINAIIYMHEIYVEHVKIVASKIIKLAETIEEN